jgi:hypothetical protein
MPRESTLGGRDGTKIGRANQSSIVFGRYHQNAYDNVSANCGALQQGTAASIVFVVSPCRDFSRCTWWWRVDVGVFDQYGA